MTAAAKDEGAAKPVLVFVRELAGRRCPACNKEIRGTVREMPKIAPKSVTATKLPAVLLCPQCGHLYATEKDGRVRNLTRAEKRQMPMHGSIEVIKRRQAEICRDMWG